MVPQPPGLFFHLVADGVVSVATLAPLLSRLADREGFVVTAVRGGEAFESLRWPQARDAALATLGARRCPDSDGRIASALGAIDACGTDAAALRALARRTFARHLASMGAGVDLLERLWRDATPADAAVFDEPRGPEATAAVAADLCAAHHAAADGLYAYHAARGIPGPAAASAARVVSVALGAGLSIDELVAAAVGLVDAGS